MSIQDDCLKFCKNLEILLCTFLKEWQKSWNIMKILKMSQRCESSVGRLRIEVGWNIKQSCVINQHFSAPTEAFPAFTFLLCQWLKWKGRLWLEIRQGDQQYLITMCVRHSGQAGDNWILIALKFLQPNLYFPPSESANWLYPPFPWKGMASPL